MLAGFVVFTVVAIANWMMAWPSKREELLLDVESEAEELAGLAVLKSRCLSDIRDLEFDFQTGHLSEEDYHLLRDRLEGQAIAVMKRLDRLRGDTDYDARIDLGYAERFEVAAWEAPGSNLPEGVAPVVEAAAPAVKKVALSKKKNGVQVKANARVKTAKNGVAAAHACTACGHGLDADATFCSQCGHRVPPPVAGCSGCGEPLEADARFCKHCGTGVAASPALAATREA